MISAKQIQDLTDMAHKLRICSIKMVDVSGSGHPTSCSSMAEIISVLFFNVMKFTVSEPLHPSNDRFILSKGHAAPILYAAWSEAGLFPAEKLYTLRKIDSDFEGHPTPRLNFIDVATGSLGQGIGIAVGMAYDGLLIEKSSFRVYCLLGDGECMEGSVWEAAAFAGYYKLSNFCAIVDVNRLGQSSATSISHDMDTYKMRWQGFGFKAIVVDGQDVESLLKAFSDASSNTETPTVILARTHKGAHFTDSICDKMNWHGKALGGESSRVIAHLESLIKTPTIKGVDLRTPLQNPKVDLSVCSGPPKGLLSEPPAYELGKEVATRAAFGLALTKLGKTIDRMVVCDADVKNSTFTDKFKNLFPDRFVDCFIAEQNMVSVATGLSTRNRKLVFLSTFSAFLSRAYDQIRMGAISQAKIKIVGTHCGCSIGEDGGSQMGLEDIAMFRAIPNCVVLYPSDAVSAERAVELAANVPEMCYIRTSRPALPTIYKNEEVFEIGKSKICVKSDNDSLLIISAGVTLIESIRASELLAKEGIKIRVMDLFSIKPIDKESIVLHTSQCNGLVLTVEDHYPEGGLGEAVAICLSEQDKSAHSLHRICVTSLPRSGKPHEVMELYSLTGKQIADKVRSLLKK